MGRLREYFKRSWEEAASWFRRSAAFWMWLGSVGFILTFFGCMPGSLSHRVHGAGIAFEFFGISAVILGVSRARRFFGRPSILKGWLILVSDARYVFFRRPPRLYSVTADMGGALEILGSNAALRKSGTVEERVAQLEKEILELQRIIAGVAQKADEQKRQLQARIDAEIAERKESSEQVKRRIEEGVIGDSSLEIAGVAFLYLGLLFTGLASEVTSFFVWLGRH
jgi:hypothetical protein